MRPASTASSAAPASDSVTSVSGPIVGKSKRGSCPGFQTLTTQTGPRPSAAAAADRRVGALDRLDGEHAALAHHQRLPDVEPADRLGERPGEGDVGELRGRRHDTAQWTHRCEQVRRVERLRRHADPLGFDRVTERAQDRVVAAIAQPRDEGGAALVEADQVGAGEEMLLRHVAGDDGLARLRLVQRAQQRAEFAEPHPVQGVHLVRERRVGEAVERDGHHAAAHAARAACHFERQPPCPGDEPHRRERASPTR